MSIRTLSLLFLCALFLTGEAVPVHAADADADANKLFVEAMHLTRRADNTYDTKDSVRLLRGADQLLKKITSNYPQSAIAVQLSTHQLIGDFDVTEFEARVRQLACARGSYVEDFLSEYGVVSGTGPLTDACFLYRMENLLIPAEAPIEQARSDWLAVAVGYDLNGQKERARGIVLPYLGILRKSGSGTVGPDSYLMLAKALTLTGAEMQAQQVADHITDCAGRLSTLMTMLQTALWQGKDDDAKTLASRLQREAEANSCEWQMGLAVQALALTGQQADAKALYDKIAARRSDEAGQGAPPDLAIAASMLDEPAQAVTLAKNVSDRDPAVIPAVILQLAKRGEVQGAHDLASDLRDPVKKAAALAALVVGASGKDTKAAEPSMKELQDIRRETMQVSDQAMVLGYVARAEKAFYKDERWRDTFQLALNAAERADDNARGPIITSLAASLAAIKAGRNLLD